MLEARGLKVVFGSGRTRLAAVDGVDLRLAQGRTLGLVGESGSGKSTLARALIGLVPVSGGNVFLEGMDVTNPNRRQRAALRGTVSMVFQDPAGSLNPRMQVGEAVEEVVGRKAHLMAHHRAMELLQLVGLDVSLARRYPHQLSGGQRQRVAVARALASEPKVLILDEITSALDVLVQATVLNLLRRLQSDLGLTYLFISHNLSVIRYMSDNIAHMYLGRILEQGATDEMLAGGRHPYTRALVDAVPVLGKPPEAKAYGEVADPRYPPPGCRYHPRCEVGPMVNPERTVCVERDPSVSSDGSPTAVACHFVRTETSTR